MLSKEEFKLWKDEEVTKAIFKFLEYQLHQIEADILNVSGELRSDVHLVISHLAGQRVALSNLLNLEIEELNDETC